MRNQPGNTITTYFDIGTGAVGPVLDGASAVSFSIWLVIDSLASTDARSNTIFEVITGSGTTAFNGIVDNVTDPGVAHLRVRGAAASGETVRALNSTTVVPTGALTHLAGAVDYANDMIYCWVNGVETSGAGSFVSTAFTYTTATETDRLGQSADLFGNRALDSAIGEFSFWRRVLTLNEIKALAAGVPPSVVDRPSLYWSIGGYESPEIDLILGKTLTLVGTHAKRTEQPPVLPIESLVAQGGFPFGSSVFNVAPLASNLMRRKAA